MVIEAALAENFSDLPLIVGTNAAAQAQFIYTALEQSPSVSANLDAIIHVGDRRWDIVMTGDRPRIMLPEHNPAKALALIERLQKSHRILDMKLSTIDLRVNGRLIVRQAASVERNRGAA